MYSFKNLNVIMIALAILILTAGITRAAWDIETVESLTNAGKFTSLALDSTGAPHIAYYNENTPGLKYAYKDSGSWQFEVPTGSSGMGYYNGLVLPEDTKPHILHHDPAAGKLMWTWKPDGTHYDTAVLDPAGHCGLNISAARMGEFNFVVCHYNSDSNSIRTAYGPTGGLIYDTVDTGIDNSSTAVQVDSTNMIHIVYDDENTGSIKYAYGDGMNWTIVTIATNVVVPACALVVDDDNHPHCLFVESESGDIRYAYHNGSSWDVSTAVPAACAAVLSVDLELDSNGFLHACYNSIAGTLIYMTKTGSTWSQELVDDDGNVGGYCSMALDSQNIAHISYYDRDKKDLKYASQLPPPTPTPTPESITTELVMDDTYYTAGETFLLERTWFNSTTATSVDEYILLDVLGQYWFWPGWTPELDYSRWTVPVGGPVTETILTFTWPQVAGEFNGIRFWGAFLAAGTQDLIHYHMIEWGYGETPPALTLTSTAFTNGGAIPSKYTCDGVDVSPDLSWNQPENTIQSYALIVDDPDAPGGDWVHWVAYRIPDDSRGFPENVPANPELADGTRQGENSWGTIGYRGPCPPSGVHRYFFKLYALDNLPDLAAGATKAELLDAMQGHILYQAELMGTYE